MHTVALSSEGEVWTWGVNDEGALGRCTAGTAWEDAPEADKGDAFEPGRAALPEGVRATQVEQRTLCTPARLTASGARCRDVWRKPSCRACGGMSLLAGPSAALADPYWGGG
jgi:hypothetical protein